LIFIIPWIAQLVCKWAGILIFFLDVLALMSMFFILNIDGMHAADQIQLLDLQGKSILSGNQQSKSLDISTLEKGVYLLRVTREGKHIQTVKILKD
jgi:hypothetical protein